MDAVLFDMDGTLVPMDQDKFTKAYFSALCGALAPHGYEAGELVDAVWRGTAAMVKNDGSATNREVFWRTLEGIYGERMERDKALFDDFYINDFDSLKAATTVNPAAAETVARLAKRGVPLVLASNPVFPMLAQRKRVGWAGVDPDVFALITSYENSRYCKPNPAYYSEIVKTLGVRPEHCLMIGNDTREDLAAAKAGLDVFVLTDCIIDGDRVDLSALPHGGFDALNAYLDEVGL